MSQDTAIRIAAGEYLAEQTSIHGEVLPRSLLTQGFPHGGAVIKLLGPQGIFKPAAMELPLSITTAPMSPRKPRPYEDELGDNGYIRYKYRGTDPDHPENRGLRKAMRQRLPLIYFFGIVEGQYMPVWPVFIVGDDPQQLTFLIQAEDGLTWSAGGGSPDSEASHRRNYVTVLAKRRLHQASFRGRVLEAYRRHCAICRLRHLELLDAAHILPDSLGGSPSVRNGLALCKLHHAAFDRNVLGIRPDLVVDVRASVLREKDGPMLLHGLQGVHGAKLLVPHREELRPDEGLLERRYETFRKAE